jgi:hypothetical protein
MSKPTLVASKFLYISTNLLFIIKKRTLLPYVPEVSDFAPLYGARLASYCKRFRNNSSAALKIMTLFKYTYYLLNSGVKAKRPPECEIAILEYDMTRSGFLPLKRL